MARPRSDKRRSAIMLAATRLVAVEGLGAATAAIAKEAGVSNGSLFTYFETKSDLFNQLYLELKIEMAGAALDGLPSTESIREKMHHIWIHWLRWATSCPKKRRTLALLSVSGDITAESHAIAAQAMAGIAGLLEKSRENGPMRDAPLGFVAALMNALADTTIDFMIRDPANADKHAASAFEALWRIVT